MPDRLAALRVPDGPVRKELAEGRPVTLADGRMVDPNEVLGPPDVRKKLVIVGDADTTNGLAEHARDADVLVIEATFLDRDAAIARDYGHLTAHEAAALAATSNVKQLVLTHISGRYTDDEILTEARKTFPNSRLAMDFDHILVDAERRAPQRHHHGTTLRPVRVQNSVQHAGERKGRTQSAIWHIGERSP
jgi:ribonuclease Z